VNDGLGISRLEIGAADYPGGDLTKGQKKQDEAMQLLTQLLTISQGSTATPVETDLIREAEPETRALIDALIAFQNRTTAAADAPPARR